MAHPTRFERVTFASGGLAKLAPRSQLRNGSLNQSQESGVASPGFEHVAQSGPAELRERCILGPLKHHPLDQLTFSLRAPQRNRNELGETTVNKTCRKHLARQEKSIT
jgi:hypothetical protein